MVEGGRPLPVRGRRVDDRSLEELDLTADGAARDLSEPVFRPLLSAVTRSGSPSSASDPDSPGFPFCERLRSRRAFSLATRTSAAVGLLTKSMTPCSNAFDASARPCLFVSMTQARSLPHASWRASARKANPSWSGRSISLTTRSTFVAPSTALAFSAVRAIFTSNPWSIIRNSRSEVSAASGSIRSAT